MRIEKILSEFDGLGLEIAVIVPEGNPKGVIQFSHGICYNKTVHKTEAVEASK